MRRTWNDLQRIQKEIQTSEKNLEILHTIERLTLVKFKAAPSGGNPNTQPGGPVPAGTSQTGTGNPQAMQSMKSSSGNPASTNSNQASSMQTSSMGSSSGGSGLADLYRVQIEIGELENNISLLKNQQTTITARFNAYLNRSPLSPVQLPDEMTPGFPWFIAADGI